MSTRMQRATLQFRCLYFWLTCLVVSWICLADWLTVGAAPHLPRPSGPPASVRIFHTAPRPTTYRVRRSAPANARFCGAFGISITPSALPLRSNTSIPAELATYRRPCASMARPSAPLDRAVVGLFETREFCEVAPFRDRSVLANVVRQHVFSIGVSHIQRLFVGAQRDTVRARDVSGELPQLALRRQIVNSRDRRSGRRGRPRADAAPGPDPDR